MAAVRRRTLLLGLAAAGATAALCRHPAPSLAAERAPTGILSSTKTSTLTPRAVTAYHPPAGRVPSGAFAVGRRDFAFARGADRPLPTRVWYPATGTPGGPVTAGATPAPGSYALVIFSHGMSSQPDDYAAMLTGWARAGFVVAAPLYPHTSLGTADLDMYDIVNQPADASAVLTRMLALNAGGDPLSGHLDATRVAAAGHSAGGITTVGLFSADRDPRLRAGVVLAGTDFRGAPFTGPAAAMLFVHGQKDDTVAYGAGHTVFAAVPWSRAMLNLPDGGHLATVASQPAITATTAQFLRWSLYGDTAARRHLPAASRIGHVATLDDQLGAGDLSYMHKLS
jgi:dienelactone hydrolase